MQVLDSIRVVELTEALAGPYCAMMLGDLGADVIKVERRESGDQSRSWGPPFVGSESAYFLATNRNKRSLSLDYDQPLGAEILHRLLATADVFLINQRNLASMKRRGLDAETICARYPRLIFCAISGYGHSGPRSGLAGYDIIAQAQAGIMSFTGEPEGEPIRYPIAIADMICGLYSALGILAALLAREKTGAGQALDMALFDSQLTLLINAGSNYLNAGDSPQRWGNAHPSIVPYQVFPGGDGRHFVAAIGTDALWQRFLRVIHATETLGADARFRTNALRTKNRQALIPALCTIFAKAPADEWLSRLTAEDIPASAIQTVGEALHDPQALARGLVVEIKHPTLDIVRSIANPVRLSSTPVLYRLPPPLLGEHNHEILQSLAYSNPQIAHAVSQGAV
ncbi:MAG: CaiB/BaiF CoA-transferase family protein [Acidobacteriaceae bacterium]|jgi:crotonobetainyl-CoA:carnitine CoA-transferase CaiB-like acyl-CoA transferase